MSDKVWITASSKVIPFEKMTDEHIANAIDWCGMRIRAMEKIPASERPDITRTSNREWARVSDLRNDLNSEANRRAAEANRRAVEAKAVAEAKARQQTSSGVWLTLMADKSGHLNGTYVEAGKPVRYYIAPGRQLVLR